MTNIINRKKQHIDIIQNNPVEPFTSSFDHYRLPYKALPEIDMKKIDTKTDLFGYKISQPLIISSMSGGEKHGELINRNIAIAAESEKVAFGLGSMRVIIEHPESLKTFAVKKYCPSVPMFANIGLVQLNYGFTYEKIQKILDLVEANGIFLHINHLQEAIQPEGNTNFEKLLPKLEKLITKVQVPIIIKETGHGIDYFTASRLKDIGVKWLDVSGTGGTSWAWIEAYRAPTEANDIFKWEGIPTTECLETLKPLKLNLIAGGGIRNGLHMAKALALGAKLTTAAKPFMHAALESEVTTIKLLQRLKKELTIAMFSCGCKNLKEMAKIKIVKINPVTGMKIN